MTRELCCGSACFGPLLPSLREMRAAARRALLEGEAPQRYIAVSGNVYYPGVLDRLLTQPDQMAEILQNSGLPVDGRRDGALVCALLEVSGQRGGLLLHAGGAGPSSAYVPLPSRRDVARERALRGQMQGLASGIADVPVQLERPIAAGRYALGELIALLANHLDVQAEDEFEGLT